MTHFAYRMARTMDPILQFGNAVRVPREAERALTVSGPDLPVRTFGWKRLIDIVLSLLALVAASPIMLFAALAVKLTSPGPVLFDQERVGLDRRFDGRRIRSSVVSSDRRGKDRRVVIGYGSPFTIYKFRSMVTNAEQGRPMWAEKNDARITPVGRFIRMTRIDELPQFLNVLKGDMSIVGPRPERAYFIGRIEKDLPEFQARLRTRPGITGLAQVELGYTNTDEGLRRKLDFDLEYISRLNPWTDIRILFKTVFVVLTGKGAC